MTHATSPAAVWKERAREAMTRFVAVREQGDLAAVDEISGKDLTYQAPPVPDMGRDGGREFVDGFRAGSTDIHVQMQEHLVDGATSVHRWTVEAVPVRDDPLLPGIEATGKHTTGRGAHVLHWSREQVSEAWHVGDRLGWLTMAGVLPPMPGTGT
jgi:hypothetical protein